MNELTRSGLLLMVGLAIVAAGCDDDDPMPPAPALPGTVTLEFVHQVDGVALVLDELSYTNAVDQTYSVQVFKYYVSRLELVQSGAAGAHALAPAPLADLHYVEEGIASTRSLTVADVAAGSYDRLRFVFGLNEQDNITDGLAPTLENINMIWPDPLGGGYHYMKFEGKFFVPGSDTLNYRTHVGRTGAVGTGTPHFVAVELPTALTVDGNSSTIEIVVNLNEWYTNPNDYTFPVNSEIMANVAVQDTLEQNGATVFTLGTVTQN